LKQQQRLRQQLPRLQTGGPPHLHSLLQAANKTASRQGKAAAAAASKDVASGKRGEPGWACLVAAWCIGCS